jgi:hypothetical protein
MARDPSSHPQIAAFAMDLQTRYHDPKKPTVGR